MNERCNQIRDNFPSTFYWVLGIQDNSDLYTDSSDSDRVSSSDLPSDDDLDAGELGDQISSTSRDPSSINPNAENYPWDNFVEWLESKNDLYWISGKPGSGKSTLMKFIASRPETRRALKKWRPNPRIMSHYIWMAGSQAQRSVKGILCSLRYQSVEAPRDCIHMLLERHSRLRSKDSVSDWANNALHDLTIEFLRASDESFCIFLDGLDEISP